MNYSSNTDVRILVDALHSIGEICTALSEKFPAQLEPDSAPSGIDLIAMERDRQMRVEGFDASHDVQWVYGELVKAAVYYALPSPRDYGIGWPFGSQWNKKEKHSRIRQLMIAGALIAAEIDRLNRMES